MDNPERFDPNDGAGKLIDSEHRARYRWAARLAAGKDVLDAACGVGYGIEILAAEAKAVTGVDIDPEAVAEAERRHGASAAAVLRGDLLELPFEAESFDVVICFEAIEHVEDHERALAELRRVLRPDGVLVISTPNPAAYLEGNEYHVREFSPPELATAVGKHFANVALHRQDAWLGSRIAPAEGGAADATPRQEDVISTAEEPAEADFGIVLGSESELPAVAPLAAIGQTFDLRWWSDQLANREREIARHAEREAQVRRRLYEAEEALAEANKELAEVLLLRHRLEALEKRHGELSETYSEVLGSRSWKITKPLRRG